MKVASMKSYLLAACVLCLAGCAQQNAMYQWGGYDAMLYQSYKNPEKAAELRQGLETHIAKLEQSQQKVAPGLYAELGTIYLQAGNRAQAAAMYGKERAAWPESQGLMDALIKNTEKPLGDKAEAK